MIRTDCICLCIQSRVFQSSVHLMNGIFCKFSSDNIDSARNSVSVSHQSWRERERETAKLSAEGSTLAPVSPRYLQRACCIELESCEQLAASVEMHELGARVARLHCVSKHQHQDLHQHHQWQQRQAQVACLATGNTNSDNHSNNNNNHKQRQRQRQQA